MHALVRARREHFRPITKFTKQIAEQSTVPYLVRDCIRIATEEKPGPVHLELPEDIAALPVAADTHLFPPHPIRRPIPDEKAIANCIDLLKAVSRETLPAPSPPPPPQSKPTHHPLTAHSQPLTC